MRKSILADISLFFVAIVWGGGFVAVKDALYSIKPFYLVAIRFFFAALLLGIIFNHRMKNMRKYDFTGGVIIGIFVFGGFAFQTVALQYTLPGKQSFLTAVYVVMVPFLYWIIKKKRPDYYSVFSAILTLAGIGLLTLQKNLAFNIGDILTLVCALLFAIQIIAVDYFAKDCDPIVLSIVQMFVASIISAILGIIFEPFPYTLGKNAFLPMIYLIIFSTMIAYLIENIAQKYTSPVHAAIIMSLESVFGAIFSVIFLGEMFTFNKTIGCIIIFIAIIISETKLSFLKWH